MGSFCSNCGAKLNGDERFCGACGARCEEKPIVPPAPEPVQVEHVQEPVQAEQGQEPVQAEHLQEPAQTEHVQEPVQAEQVQEPVKAEPVQEPVNVKPAPKRARKPLLIAVAAVAVVVVLAVLAGKLYYLPRMLPESVLTSEDACDWVAQQVQMDTGVEGTVSVTATVQTPTAAPEWDGLELNYDDVSCQYDLTVDGQTVSLTTEADFTTGFFPGSVKRIEFQEFQYPNSFLMEQPDAPAVDTDPVTPELPERTEPTEPEQAETADYTPLPEYHYGVWYNEKGYPFTLDETCYLVSFEGDGITKDLEAKFVRRGSEEIHTLWIPADTPDWIEIDGEVFTRDMPQEDYILPDSDKRYLTEADLESLTHKECCLARNEIYARHGRKFTNEEIAAYFAEKDWYEGTIEPQTFDSDTSRYFNDYEVKNIQLLQQYEKEKFGGSYY